ncbi:hypothetical protein [Exiguobacterium antarcticum]|nr:hypothetical protein [Exiguobacterium antarcticum]
MLTCAPQGEQSRAAVGVDARVSSQRRGKRDRGHLTPTGQAAPDFVLA